MHFLKMGFGTPTRVFRHASAWWLCSLVLLTSIVSSAARTQDQKRTQFALSSDPAENQITTVAGSVGNGFAGDGGPGPLARLSFPWDVALDASGNTFIADEGNHRIRKLSADGVITTVAGIGGFGFGGDGGPATAAQLSMPLGIALDSSGNIFIADTNNHRVRKVTPAGIISTVAGTGIAGFGGDGGPGTAAQLSFPNDVATDAAGNIFIADSANYRIRKLAPSGVISTVAGSGIAGFGGDGGPAIAAKLSSLGGIAIDSFGALFIADITNHRIRRVNTGGIITTVAGAGVAGFGGDGGPAVSAQLLFPGKVAVDESGQLFIGDTGNHRVRRVNTAGVIETVAGTGMINHGGDGGPAISAQLYSPRGVAVDASGALWIADTENNRIRKVRAVPPGTPAITSIVPSTGPRGAVIATRVIGVNLNGATAVAVSGTGVTASISAVDAGTAMTVNITIAPDAPASTRTLIVTTPAGQSEFFVGFGVTDPVDDRVINTVAGNGTPGFSGDGGAATSAQFNSPYGVALDGAGNLFVADQFNNRIRRVTAQGAISTVAGTGSAGFGGDGVPATSASLNAPIDVAIDGAGNLFIADYQNNRIRKVTPAGIISTVAGNGTAAFSGDGGPATAASLYWPSGVALDNAGNLFIADSSNNRVRQVNAAGIITTVAGTGIQGYGGDGGPANLARLYAPTRVAVNAVGDLFVTEQGRVRKVSSMGVIYTVAGNGQQGIDHTEGSPAVSVPLFSVRAIAFDPAGNLLIAENDRIRRVDASGAIRTIAGGGTGLLGDGSPPTMVYLYEPAGIAVDAAGNLFIAERGYHRIRSVTRTGTGAPVLSSISITSGTQGTTLAATLTGYYLSGANAVVFSGTGDCNHRQRRQRHERAYRHFDRSRCRRRRAKHNPYDGIPRVQCAGRLHGERGAVAFASFH